MINPNDKLASKILSAKVGTLRVGAGMANGLNWVFDEAADDMRLAPTKVRGRITKLAKAAGKQIEEELGSFAERRLDTIYEKLNDVAGGELKKPRSPGSLNMFRGSVAKHIEKAASSAKSDAPRRVKAGEPGAQAIGRMRHQARTVSRTAANSAHNAAVLAIARANKSSLQGVTALATLDDRTTKHICIPRHGGAWDIVTKQALPWSSIDIPFPGRPPWHFNCRTTLSIVLLDELIPTEQTRELDQWVKTQDAVQALGSDRIKLYKQGILTRSQLTSQDGRSLTLKDL